VTSRKNPDELATKWKDAWNSHDLDRIMALYRDDVTFKSPRVRTVSGEESGILRGKSAVRDYCRRIFERRPDLNLTVDHVFAGVDSVALEYRAGNGLHGIEFMTVDADGLVTFAVGNDVVR
jgi:ketosteroid isomerase-like protein